MLRDLFRNKDGQAFPGDTYLADMHKASKRGNSWAKILLLATILGFFADLYFLHDTVDIAFDNAAGSFLSLYSWVVAATLVVLYLFIGYVIGKKLREYKAFKNGSSFAVAILSTFVLLVALVFLTVFRLSAELEVSVGAVLNSFFVYLTMNEFFVEVSKVFVMTLVMTLSAFIGALYSYYSGDAITESVYRESVAALPADRSLYKKVFFEYSNNIERERSYEEQERQLDKRAVESAFKLGDLASQLNGVVDPADAYEFLEAKRLITNDYFNGERS